VKLVTARFFLNNEIHEKTQKKFMEAALTARMRRYAHEIFFVLLSARIYLFEQDFLKRYTQVSGLEILAHYRPIAQFSGGLIRSSNNLLKIFVFFRIFLLF